MSGRDRRLSERERTALERAEEIRHRHAAGETAGALGREFGLHKATVGKILRGQLCARAGGPTVTEVMRKDRASKLSRRDVRAIRRAVARGVPTQALCERYGLGVLSVQRLARGELRPEVGGPFAEKMSKRIPDEVVEQIRLEHQRGATQTALVTRYGLNRSTISCLLRGERYGNAPGPLAPRKPSPKLKWLTDEQVLAIRKAYVAGTPMSELARKYQKLPASIGHIVAGRTYRNVGGPSGPSARRAHLRARRKGSHTHPANASCASGSP